jgi:hypothetical protein
VSEPDNTPGPAEQLGRAFALCAAVLGTIGLLGDFGWLLWLAVGYELAAAYYLRPGAR